VHSFTVKMLDFRFEPRNLTIAPGDTVTWVNQGTVQHTTTSGTSCNADGRWNSGLLSPGQSFTFVFPDSGSYPYFCIPHCLSDMRGAVNVVP